MRVEKFDTSIKGKLSSVVKDKYPNLSYNKIQKIIREKDIKVNRKRVGKDIDVAVGDEIILFINEDLSFYEIVFEDENILVVNKKRNIEVVSETDNDLVKQIKADKKIDVFAVHRLDRNTEGLVVFAKNEVAKNELDVGFKGRLFEKFYLALCYGVFEKKSEKLIAYLKKDQKNSLVDISDCLEFGYEQILTNYRVINQGDEVALVEVELLTGKTHQIRAHLAHIGHFIIGDEKYGNKEINQKHKKKYQNLIAYKLILHFSKNSKLFYLDNKCFEIDKKKISFFDKC